MENIFNIPVLFSIFYFLICTNLSGKSNNEESSESKYYDTELSQLLSDKVILR